MTLSTKWWIYRLSCVLTYTLNSRALDEDYQRLRQVLQSQRRPQLGPEEGPNRGLLAP